MKPSRRRVPLLVLALIILLPFALAAGGQSGGDGGSGEATEAGREVFEYTTIATRAEAVERPSLFEQFLEEKFGIRLVYEQMNASDAVSKLNLLFATGEAPDVYLSQILYIDDMKRWGLEGVLVPMSDYMDRMPNYRKMWTEAEWEFMLAGSSSSDGTLYWLPIRRIELTQYSYIWRKGTFEKMGLSFPATTDELYETLKTIKREVPESIPYSNRFGVGWLMDGFTLPFRTARVWHISPDSGQLVYGPVENQMREALSYAHKLYGDGLIEPEFPTSNTQTWTERFAKGLPYFQYSYPNRAEWANQTMREVDPDAGWVPSHQMLVADLSKKGSPDEQLHSRRNCAVASSTGVAVNIQVTGERLNRLLEYFDWAVTEEGNNFHAFGVEGKTMEYMGGKPQYMPHMYSLNNPEGDDMIHYGFTAKEMDGFLLAGSPDALSQRLGTVYTDLCAAMEDEPFIHDQIAWKLTTDQEKELADLVTVIQDVWEEYATKFVLGKLDPGNDAHWNEYLETMNKAGLPKEIAIRKAVFPQSKVY